MKPVDNTSPPSVIEDIETLGREIGLKNPSTGVVVAETIERTRRKGGDLLQLRDRLEDMHAHMRNLGTYQSYLTEGEIRAEEND